MYLTRFRLNTARMGARKLLSSPQRMHAAVLAGFPELTSASSGEGRVLWRVDRGAKAKAFLYVVSQERPDYTHLVEQAGWPTLEGGWETSDYTPFLEKLTAGDVWAFRLTANPVHKVRTCDGQEDTKTTPHITQHHQAEWLLQRQEKAGFRVVRKAAGDPHPDGEGERELLVHDQRRLEFRKKRGDKSSVSLSAVTFDGRLEVTDPETLRRTLIHGLGRAKAYGCGLMTLAPSESWSR
ncbi:CRISPR system Cascade subunit CasE [Haloactinospora alba]|uniref:CRISPR system Cascade subunit CasE n=1 Tax=Haloactinospora alba TaxID=405555 RepID=A0A543NHE8_9ACTN|nr:type I-E CRISPR-associated protein Cas6/Cse3/CasE [Haloactinospora alba]TQN31180.1 CRISPR system Cascade subunit CasE [Haloactinospora alba]